MKTKILFFVSILFLMTLNLQAQAPEKFNYQGIARDASGEPLINQALGVKISILDGSTEVYVETHSVTTNGFGLYTIQIGDGTPITGTMAGVDWSNGNKFIEVGIDPNGGTNYVDLGTTELLSVPYALYAESGGGGGTPSGAAGGDLSGNYPNPSIANNAVTSVKIDNGTISNADLANHAVTGIKIAAMGATTGQVLKWDETSTSWVPQNDLEGTAGSTYTAGTGIAISGTNEISADLGTDIATAEIQDDAVTASKLNDMGAANGEVLKWDGTTWAPGTDVAGTGGGSYTAGTGIAISGDVISADLGTDIDNAELVNGAVTTGKLANDAVTAAKIDAMGATNGQVLKFDGTNWAPAADIQGTTGTTYTAGTGIAISGSNEISASLGTDVESSEIVNGTIAAADLANDAVIYSKIDATGATNGQVLKFNGTDWAPAADIQGTTGTTYTAGTGIAISGSNEISADLGINIDNSELVNGAVTTGKLANDAVTAAKIAAMGATNGQVLKFDGTDWAPASDNPGAAGWKLSGNAATATDFIGTTNSEPLRFKQNNQPAGIISSENTAFGINALLSNTTGAYNVANGSNSLYSNTTGGSNTAIGFSALFDNTTGQRNTATGAGVLANNSTGSWNTGSGNDALLNNTTGNENTATGFQALYSNTIGEGNVATGYKALNLNTTGVWNTAVGRFALSNNTTGYYNTAIGVFGLDSNETGNLNTSLGHNADVLGNNLTNATAIGANAEVAQDNSLILGSIAGTNGALSNTKVGIGTSMPRAILEVQGNTLQNITVGGLAVENAGLLVSDGTITSGDAMRSIVTFANGSSSENQGILAVANGEAGANVGSFFLGLSSDTSTSDSYGVYGSAYGGANAYGVYGTATNGSSSNYAGFFIGDVMIIGNLAKSGGTFKIDNPLDPANKYLSHSFVESPEMMNIYNGNVTTDANGYVTVTMPNYFNALNKDYRYQLTVIGTFAQAIISEKMQGNQFVIRTNKPNVEVSWQVTGVRADKWANANRVKPVTEKEPGLRGYYLNPKAYGLPVTKGVGFKTMPPSAQKLMLKKLNNKED